MVVTPSFLEPDNLAVGVFGEEKDVKSANGDSYAIKRYETKFRLLL